MSLSDDVGRLLAALQGAFGFFARNLSTGEVAEVNANQVLPTESAAKPELGWRLLTRFLAIGIAIALTPPFI